MTDYTSSLEQALAKQLLLSEKAAAFKEYTHARLDSLGVPHDHNPEQTRTTGCRIEGRLDWVGELIVRADNDRLGCQPLEARLEEKSGQLQAAHERLHILERRLKGMAGPEVSLPSVRLPLPANLQRLRDNWERAQGSGSPQSQRALEAAKEVKKFLYGAFEDVVSEQGHYISVRVYRSICHQWTLSATLGKNNKAECQFSYQDQAVMTQLTLGNMVDYWSAAGPEEAAEGIAEYLYRAPTISLSYSK